MMVSTILTALLMVGSYDTLPVTTEAPQDPGRPVEVYSSSRSSRSYIGVSIQSLNRKLAKANGNKVDEGAMINEVEEKSPAAEAGLKEGDVVVQFGERMIYDAEDLSKAVRRVKPGTKVDVKIDRKGASQTLALTVGKNPNRMSKVFSHNGMGMHMFGSSKAIGADLRPLSEQLGKYFQAPDGKGVLVESVEKESAAEKAGLKAGDVIVKLAGEQVEELSDVWDILSDYEGGEKVDIEVIRKGSTQKLSVEIEEGDEGNYYHFRTEPWGMGFDGELGEDFDMRLKMLPRFHIEKYTPELEELKFKMDELKEDIRMKVRPEIPKLKIERLIKDKMLRRI
ncbi:MAG: PDZ domain-containing protein [Ignavibacteriae bacterium]|nr:PDZ domain-containing protein [Ignavibacteriota bacterium]